MQMPHIYSSTHGTFCPISPPRLQRWKLKEMNNFPAVITVLSWYASSHYIFTSWGQYLSLSDVFKLPKSAQTPVHTNRIYILSRVISLTPKALMTKASSVYFKCLNAKLCSLNNLRLVSSLQQKTSVLTHDMQWTHKLTFLYVDVRSVQQLGPLPPVKTQAQRPAGQHVTAEPRPQLPEVEINDQTRFGHFSSILIAFQTASLTTPGVSLALAAGITDCSMIAVTGATVRFCLYFPASLQSCSPPLTPCNSEELLAQGDNANSFPHPLTWSTSLPLHCLWDASFCRLDFSESMSFRACPCMPTGLSLLLQLGLSTIS